MPKIRNPNSTIRNPRVAAVIAAGGTGTRIGAKVPKQFLKIAGKPVLVHTLESVLSLPEVVQVVIALPPGHIPRTREILAQRSWGVPVEGVRGGSTRQESVRRAV